MKRSMAWGLALVGALLWAAPGRAQVELSWSLAHNRTLLMEPVLATVRVVNNSGVTLDFTPRGNARLSFDVEDQPTSPVPTTGRPLLPRPILIPAGETRDVDVNLLEAYVLIKGQTYKVTPVLEFAGTRFIGERQYLEVQPGLELLKRTYGVPNTPSAREVSLRQLNRDRNDRLFFRLDNPQAGICLGAYELGRVIRFFVPTLELDHNGVFHTLHQAAPDRFVHSQFSYDGALLGATLYVGTAGAMKLARTETGDLEVQGGTPFTTDPDNPEILVAPALPPAHPFPKSLEDVRARRKAADKKAPPRKKTRPAPSRGQDDGTSPVSW